MIINMVSYGGGGKLNAKIVGGTTRPTGSQDLTWINTPVEISTVYVDDVPASPVNGDILIAQGVQSQITTNISSDDGVIIPIHPITAVQYISGAWTEKAAQTYQSGTWLLWDPSIIYFDAGDQCAAKTGGWSDTGWIYYKSTYVKTAPIIADDITIAYSAANGCSIAGTGIKVDLTNIATLHARVTATANGSAKLCASTIKNSHSANTVASVNLTVGDVFIDLSGVPSGSYYIALSASGSTTYPSDSATVSKIWGMPI